MKLFHYTYENHIPVAETIIKFLPDDPHTVEIHNNVYRFDKTVFKKMLVEFEIIKANLKDVFNIDKIIACANRDDKKLYKYWKMFGFEKIMPLDYEDQKLIYAEMEI